MSAHPRLVAGVGAFGQLGALARELGATRALLVTDPGIVTAGHAGKACDSLRAAGIVVTVFDQVRENPTTEDVDACLAIARSATPDLLIGLGGGSAMDAAKGCNFLLTNGGKMADYWHTGAAVKPLLPFIAVPTTAGTGSECQSYALITDPVTHRKMACGDPKALARIALLDPGLTTTQPRRVTAATGLDAIGHAVECLVTARRNPVSHLFAREAFVLLHAQLPVVLADPADLQARAAMQLGAAYAGLAIEHSMLGAAHACANPLTAYFGVIHGEAVALMLPAVVAYNAQDPVCAALYAELAERAGLIDKHAERDAVSALILRLNALIDQSSVASLASRGITDASIAALADDAATQWTAANNPRPVTAVELAAIYRLALAGRS
ncbi:iron alcohol dehydrogenase [Planctomycetota bacterium]|nr:iron alcohol dehydrogenase [Planctomycetota bacterium]